MEVIGILTGPEKTCRDSGGGGGGGGVRDSGGYLYIEAT